MKFLVACNVVYGDLSISTHIVTGYFNYNCYNMLRQLTFLLVNCVGVNTHTISSKLL